MQALIDEAWAKVDPVAARNAGFQGIIGYVSQDTTGKNLTPSDVARIHAAMLVVGLVYEFDPQSAARGASQGTADARIAVAHAQGLNAPQGTCLYAAVDWNVPASQLPAVLAYALAFAAVCRAAGFRYGIYAGYAVVAYLWANGYGGFLWQTYAWSNGAWLAQAAVRQVANGIFVAGVDVDRDEAEVLDWGQWLPDGGTLMGQPTDSWGQQQVYAAIFTGGSSCGDTVPREYWSALETTGNGILTKLNYLQSKIDALTVPASVLDDADKATIQQLATLLTQVAAHLK